MSKCCNLVSDCPVLDISSNAIMNSNEMYKTSFRSEVTLTCDTGYSFKQEEYNQMSAVTIRCEKGGKWNVSRIPDCMSMINTVALVTPTFIPNDFFLLYR